MIESVCSALSKQLGAGRAQGGAREGGGVKGGRVEPGIAVRLLV